MGRYTIINTFSAVWGTAAFALLGNYVSTAPADASFSERFSLYNLLEGIAFAFAFGAGVPEFLAWGLASAIFISVPVGVFYVVRLFLKNILKSLGPN